MADRAMSSESKKCKFACTVCGNQYLYKSSLSKHVRVTKRCRDLSLPTGHIKCSVKECKQYFHTILAMASHVKIYHSNVGTADGKIEYSVLKFQNMDEFFEWKAQEESDRYCYFSKRADATHETKNIRYMTYTCQHNGHGRSHYKGGADRLTSKRWKKGRIKTGKFCPARLLIKGFSDRVIVNYITTHSHELKVQDRIFHPMPQSVITMIERRIASGASTQDIVNDCKTSTDPNIMFRNISSAKVNNMRKNLEHNPERWKELQMDSNDVIDNSCDNVASYLEVLDHDDAPCGNNSDNNIPANNLQQLCESAAGSINTIIRCLNDEYIQRTILPDMCIRLQEIADHCSNVLAENSLHN